jgi:hypothetical protein
MRFSRLTLSDVDPWAELMAVCFARQTDEMRALWQWFHQGWKLVAWGGWEQGQLVAQYTSLINNVNAPDGRASFRVGLSVNMAVHPDYRGRGLVKSVAQPVYDTLQGMGVVAGVGFSNAEGVKVDRRSKGYGYRVVGKLQPNLLWLTSRRGNLGPLRLSSHWPAGEWALAPGPRDRFRFDVDPAWLQHRFAGHPFRKYRFGVREEEARISGIVIDRPLRFYGITGSALLMAHGPDLPDLLTRWRSAIRAAGGRFVHWLATPTSALTIALRTSDVALPLPYSRSPYYLTARPLTTDLPVGFTDFRRWDCVGGDIL